MIRNGDFTNKYHVYKIFKKGYTTNAPKYITQGQNLNISYSVGGAYDNTINAESIYEPSTSELRSSITSGSNGAFITITTTTDSSRPIDLEGCIITFGHDTSTTGFGTVYNYIVSVFDLSININIDATTITATYDGATLSSVALTSSYDYLRIREVGGTLYVDRSSDGITWTNWTSAVVDFDNDTTSSPLEMYAQLLSAGVGYSSAFLSNLEAYDRSGNILAIETSKVISDLQFTKNINTPASSTVMRLGYAPQEKPDYIVNGNYVEIYTHFYNKGDISYEPILDHNVLPILDHNSEEIYGAVITNPTPEQTNILKFSGFIDAISYNYDENYIEATIISHGENASQIPVTDGIEVDSNVIQQLTQNASVSSVNQRQTFTPQFSFLLSGIRLRISAGAGGSTAVSISNGTSTSTTKSLTWSGALSANVYDFEFATEGIMLEAGTEYRITLNNLSTPITWFYQNTDVYPNGSRQTLSGSTWSNTTSDIYFELYTTNTDILFEYTGTITGLAENTMAELERANLPLSIGEIDEPGYNVVIEASVNDAQDMFGTILQRSPTGYWYTFDLGTGQYYLKAYPTDIEHNLILGRDFTGFVVDEKISDIVNDVLFIGGDVNDVQDKLAIRVTNTESQLLYKRGFEIVTNGNVTRYDSANLLAEYAVTTNASPRLTSSIRLNAAKYNIETIDVGQLLCVRNSNNDALAIPLQVASFTYTKDYVDISLDSAPITINTTVDKIQRDLNNTQTSGLGSVI